MHHHKQNGFQNGVPFLPHLVNKWHEQILTLGPVWPPALVPSLEAPKSQYDPKLTPEWIHKASKIVRKWNQNQ